MSKMFCELDHCLKKVVYSYW